ncbi:MAG: hypothetical protein QGG73_03325 [Candidatus Hydrogenedentes bacterium]|jgi:hypothetical protein|nr:hypothetical protein [Candidatus Hydrogenedentota bacterium]
MPNGPHKQIVIIGNGGKTVSGQSPTNARGKVTKSPLIAWWLKHIRRYGLLSVKRTPKAGLFGRISYRDTWTFELAKERKG